MVLKASLRVSCQVTLVSNSSFNIMQPNARVIKVGSGLDVADDYIAEHITRGDLLIAADVPLADRVVAKGAVVVSPHGQIFDHNSAKELLAMRNLMQELRSAGEISGGPPSYSDKDLKRFSSAFDKTLTQLLRNATLCFLTALGLGFWSNFLSASQLSKGLVRVGQGVSSPLVSAHLIRNGGLGSENPAALAVQDTARATAYLGTGRNGSTQGRSVLGGEVGWGSGQLGMALVIGVSSVESAGRM